MVSLASAWPYALGEEAVPRYFSALASIVSPRGTAMDAVSAKEANETIVAAGHSNPFVMERARQKMVRWVTQNHDFENEIDKAQVWALVKQWNILG